MAIKAKFKAKCGLSASNGYVRIREAVISHLSDGSWKVPIVWDIFASKAAYESGKDPIESGKGVFSAPPEEDFSSYGKIYSRLTDHLGTFGDKYTEIEAAEESLSDNR